VLLVKQGVNSSCWHSILICLYLQIHIIPVPSNHSGANSSTLHSSLCDKCRRYYDDLEKSYKKIKKSDAQDYKVCGDVSASVSTVNALKRIACESRCPFRLLFYTTYMKAKKGVYFLIFDAQFSFLIIHDYRNYSNNCRSRLSPYPRIRAAFGTKKLISTAPK